MVQQILFSSNKSDKLTNASIDTSMEINKQHIQKKIKGLLKGSIM